MYQYLMGISSQISYLFFSRGKNSEKELKCVYVFFFFWVSFLITPNLEKGQMHAYIAGAKRKQNETELATVSYH